MFRKPQSIEQICKKFANKFKKEMKKEDLSELEITIDKLQEFFSYDRTKIVTWFPQVPRKILKNDYGLTLHKQRGRNVVVVKME